MWRITAGFAGAMMLASCETPPVVMLNFVTAEEALTVPPGNAVGSEFAGKYVNVSQAIIDCVCLVDEIKEGFCNGLENRFSEEVSIIEQDDGTLLLRGADGQILSGGVNEDGTFVFGGVTPVRDDQTAAVIGDAPVVFTGQFTTTGFFATARFHWRVRLTSGEDVDCETTFETTSRRLEE